MRRVWRAGILFAVLLAAEAPLAADPEADCRERLTRLGGLCLLYARQHEGRMPVQLADLYYEAYVTDLQEFVCPGQLAPVTGRAEIESTSGYMLCAQGGSGAARGVIQDRAPDNHGGKGVHVFYADGTVRLEQASRAATPPVTVPPRTTVPTVPTAPQTPASAPQTDDIHLGQLTPVSLREGAWGKTNIDRSITGGPLGIGGRTFSRGIGTHANSEIVYDVSAAGRRYFLALVGIDQAALKPQGTCGFRVVVDGQERFVSQKLGNGEAPVPVQVEIAGARELKLITTDGGDGIWYDQANWAEARLSDRASSEPTVVTEAPLPGRLLEPPVRDTGVRTAIGQDVVMGVKVTPVSSSGAARPADFGDVLEQLARKLLSGLGLDLPEKTKDPGGLRVTELQSGSIAAWWGLQADDVLVALGKRRLFETPLAEAVAGCESQATPTLVLVRDGQVQSRAVTVLDLPATMRQALPAWSGPASGPETRAPVTDVVLCQSLDDSGRIVGYGTRFSRTIERVFCALWYQDAVSVVAQIIWYHDMTPCASCVGIMDGTGRLTAVLDPGQSGAFAPGTYQVCVRANGQTVARTSFVLE